MSMGFLSLLSNAIGALRSFEVVKNIAPNKIGVYIMYHNGEVKYIGRAIEDRHGQSTKGLRKRLQEHWRGSHTGKPELHKYRNELMVKIITCDSVQEAKETEARLIRQHDTVNNGWNLRYEDY